MTARSTEDYLLGAVCVPAFGYGLPREVLETSRPQPSAVKADSPQQVVFSSLLPDLDDE
jgi:hypothetical protein